MIGRDLVDIEFQGYIIFLFLRCCQHKRVVLYIFIKFFIQPLYVCVYFSLRPALYVEFPSCRECNLNHSPLQRLFGFYGWPNKSRRRATGGQRLRIANFISQPAPARCPPPATYFASQKEPKKPLRRKVNLNDR